MANESDDKEDEATVTWQRLPANPAVLDVTITRADQQFHARIVADENGLGVIGDPAVTMFLSPELGVMYMTMPTWAENADDAADAFMELAEEFQAGALRLPHPLEVADDVAADLGKEFKENMVQCATIYLKGEKELGL